MPSKTRFNIYLSETLHRNLKILASINQTSMNQIILDALENTHPDLSNPNLFKSFKEEE